MTGSVGAMLLAALPGCGSSSGGAPAAAAGTTIDLDVATVFLEMNATDEDLGLHLLFDGEGWRSMTITAPNGATIFQVTNGGTLSRIGSTEVFTESAEPPFTELPPAQFLALFPQGTYRFSGTTLGGTRLVGEFDLDHQMPSMPQVDTTPAPGGASASGTLLIEWTLDPALPGGGVISGGAPILKFEVVVDQEDPDGIEPPLRLSVELPAAATEFTAPAGVLVEGMEAKVEVIAIGQNGNRTAGEVGLGEVLP
jgi:hypothetical protein